MTEQTKQAIREALAEADAFADPDPKIKIPRLLEEHRELLQKALAALDAEPAQACACGYGRPGEPHTCNPQADASAEELAAEMAGTFGMFPNDMEIQMAAALITADRRAQLKKAADAIDREIAWCKGNPGCSSEGVQFEAGFIKGLEQSKIFIRAILGNE